MSTSFTFKQKQKWSNLKSLLLMMSMVFIFQLKVSAQAIYTQDFNYSGTLTSNGWTAHSAGGTSPISTTTGLTYGAHAGSGVGNAALVGPSGEDINQTFTSQSGNGLVVYSSFLCNVNDASTSKAGDYFYILGSPGGATWTAFTSRVFARIVSGNVNFGISNTSTATYGTTNFSKNTTYLIIIKYTINTGGADPVSMWVLPSGLPLSEAVAGTAEVTNLTTSGTNDVINTVGLRQGAAASAPQVIVDAIRVGLDWASVVPASASAPSTQVSAISFANSTNSATDVNWTNGNGNGRIVKMNTSNSFTTPANGTTYSATTAYSGSGEQVVYAGTGSTVNVTGLTPGQTYYFRAYEYNSTGMLYNSSTATNNPNSVILNYPSPTLTSINPTSTNAAGSSFTLTVTGSNFYNTSVVNWNGSARTTTYVNSTTLTAAITAADIATAGTATVTVTNTTPGGGTSSGQTFTINANVSPSIAVTSSLTNFIGEALVASASQSYTVSGSSLTDNISISVGAPFELSLNNSTWSNSLTLTQSGGVVTSSTVYVRLNATASGSFTGTITHSSTGASDQSISLAGSAINASPSVQSAITLTSATANSLTFSLNGGNGSGKILVASASTVTYVPTDAVAPTGVNSNWTLATDQGTGNKIVYDGSGTSVTVSGLTANTNYNFAVYSYNGSASTINYLQASPGTLSVTTLASEPTTASLVSYTRITTDTAYVNFTGGNGANRIVVINTSGVVTFSPVDGQSYSGANQALSSAFDLGSGNKLVYQGTATSAKITGFAMGSTVNVAVFEYNGTGVTTNYKTPGVTASAIAPSYISYTSGNYFQDFNTLPSTGIFATSGFGQGPYYLTSTPINATGAAGWQLAAITGADIKLSTDAGSGTSGSNYNYGSASSTDRAIGCLASSSYLGSLGAVFVNNSTGPLNKVTITYVGENWRRGGSGSYNKMLFSYKVGENSIKGSNFTVVPSLDFSTPTPVSGTGVALDGNAAANRAVITATFNLDNNWLPGQPLTIRWNDVDETGSDDGMAIDSLTFVAEGPSTPLAQDSLINFSNILTTSMDVNWSNGDATSRIVVINTSNNFTNPIDGNTYTANNVYSGSGEQIIYNGSGSTVNVTGLSASATYYFRVFAYNGSAGATKYSSATATQNPASQVTSAPQLPTKIVITSLNGGNPILENIPFTVTVQAQDNNNSPQNVSSATTIDLSVFAGSGTLGGTTSGTIAAGSNQVTISGVLYDVADYSAQLQADATSGDALGTAYSNTFDVFGVATSLQFSNTTPGVPVNTVIPTFTVSAIRSDYTVDTYYNGTSTITVSSGPTGSITGTLTATFVNGVATFNGIQFSTPGSYVLQATAGTLSSAYSSTIIITAVPTMTELVVPKYMGSKTGSAVNNARTPIAYCIQLNNLLPNTIYNLAAGLAVTSEANTTMGAGGVWNGSSYGLTISNAFTTDANGSSGPYWIYIQPSGNSSRFGAGQIHNLRIAYSNVAFGATTTPNFISTNTTTSLDIATTALSANTADDGAFVTGSLNACMGSKLVLVYDNADGTGNPLYAYQTVNSTSTQISNTEFPTSVDSIYRNLSSAGSFAAVIPVATLSSNGVRRIETRDLQNNILNYISDADGIWPSGANTTNLVRRDLIKLTNSDASLNTVTGISVNGTNTNCYGSSDGYATALATSLNNTVNYLWSAGSTTATQIGLAAGTYTVTATDGNGCSNSTSVVISQPSTNNPTASNNGPVCIGNDITLTASAGASYSWTGPHGFTSTSQVATATTTAYALSEAGAHTYSVIVTYANGCTETTSTTVVLNDCSCTPPTLSFSSTNVSCKNGANGSINLTISGGEAPYSILWSNGATTEDLSNVAAGTYKVIVTENKGCKDSLTVTITEPLTALSSTTAVTNATCNGSTNGAITLTPVGGTSPYSYVWSNNATSKDLTGITAGSYQVTITDANGCTSTTSATITEPSAITITTNSINNALCFGLNGSIDISSSADVASNSANDPGLLISEFMADPTGTDNSNEWVELIATRSINFNTTPFAVVFVNNGTATTNGWKAGAGLTYGFNLNYGSVQKGDVVYVGGSLMSPTGIKLRVISTGTVAGDAFGNLATGGVLGNGTTSADAVGVFNVGAASITSTTVPVDAIFYGTALGNAVVSSGAAGYTLPVNDKYNGGFLQPNSYFIPSNPTQGKSFYATGVFNYQTGQFTTARTWATDPTSFTESTSTISLVNSTTYLWSTGATTQDLASAPAGTYTVTVTNVTGCTKSQSFTITQPAQPAQPSLACYQTATFNTTTCSWVVTGTQPAQPSLACYQTATFNTTTCAWDVTGTQPAQPSLACYQTATFNTTTCAWDVTGTQPSQPSLACYQTATFNTTTCAWDVTGSPAATIVTTTTSCGSYTWTANGSVYTQSGTYNYSANCQDYQLQLTVVNVVISGINPSSGTVGSTVVISGTGFTGASAVQINGTPITNYTIDHDGQITAVIPVGATSGDITVTNGSCNGTSSSGFTILTNATLHLKAFIQGYYSGSGAMTAALNNQGISTISDEVDTIQIELRDAATGATTITTAKGIILTDGTVSFTLPGAVVGNSYYVVINHRNSVQTWSATAITFSTTTNYDFTTAASQAYGNNQVEIETGVYAMYSGDMNQDEFVDPYDYTLYNDDNNNFASGYFATDLNGDGFVDPYDYSIYNDNNNSFIMSAHP
ncbi:MAG: hypothetical protein ACKOX3_07625 [Bacteroidota bacterium]